MVRTPGLNEFESDLSHVLAANRNDLAQNWTRNTTMAHNTYCVWLSKGIENIIKFIQIAVELKRIVVIAWELPDVSNEVRARTDKMSV
jgi:hypothetical protein